MIEQARPILFAARCAACGGNLSTWDGGLSPLPEGCQVAPPQVRQRLVTEGTARRDCLGCGRPLVLWLWSDGENWGFQEADEGPPSVNL